MLFLLFTNPLALAAKVGEPAPDFSGVDSKGKTVSLSQLKGKYVVLEWHNEGCPYVVAQYKSKHMQNTQKEWTKKGVVWLSVISSAKGKQGYVDGKGADADVKSNGAAPTATILDPTGQIGHAYDAQTTPHMFVVDPHGTLVYNGAIDDHATTDASEVGGSINYVSAALTDSMAGKPVSHATSRPYGCGVKYP